MDSCIKAYAHPPHALLLLSLVFPFLQMLQFTSCAGKDVSVIRCIDIERQALLKFKQGLTDPSARLSSWHGEDCCNWAGLSCDNKTGNVVKIDLRNSFDTGNVVKIDLHDPLDEIISTSIENEEAYFNSCLGGEINPSLLYLKHLRYLDMSNNNFRGISIPSFIGSLKLLRHLNLSRACFTGTIPHHLGNLSRLQYLNLESICLQYQGMHLMSDSLHWLSGLPSLKYLNMGFVNLYRASTDWLDHINMLPSLLELHLHVSKLRNLPSTPPSVNFTSLAVLQLSHNSFKNSSLPRWITNLGSLATLDFTSNALHGPLLDALGTMTSLSYVYLGRNHFAGRIPRSLGNLCNLKVLFLSFNSIFGEITEFLDDLSRCPNKSLEALDLAYNQLTGLLPDSIGNFKDLQFLEVCCNRMNGTIPESIGKLSQLTFLDLSFNSFEGVLLESHLANLRKLEVIYISLSLSEKLLVLNISSNWIPPFHNLRQVDITNCILGPLFPSWLQYSQKNISYLSLRNTRVVDTLPNWVWNLHLTFLDLSYNNITGRIPSGSHLQSHFPRMCELLLRGNSFSGSIPLDIGRALPRLHYLDLSMNLLNGTFPSSICELIELRGLELSHNKLTGELPQWCWKNLQTLEYVSLANNKLTGRMPSSLIFLNSLKYLKLSNNKFDGRLPSSFQNQTGLLTIDLGQNGLSGKMPTWIGKSFPLLKALNLRSNNFTGQIPAELCFLSSLKVLNLGGNKLSSAIPRCFENLTAMAVIRSDKNFDTSFSINWSLGFTVLSFFVDMIIVKGRELNYSTNLSLLKSLDLSNNNLSGDMPQELTKLVGLNILNLSMNHFRGAIPEKIGQLKQLESLDLSQNQLTGAIPPTIASMSFLSHLNLSHNNLSGRIPTGNQLQTLNDASVYEGNPELCGPPLTNKCKEHGTDEDPPPSTESVDEEDGMQSFYVSMAIGFVVGFSGVCGVLVLKRSWRHSYFRFLDDLKERIYVFISIKMAHIRGRRG